VVIVALRLQKPVKPRVALQIVKANNLLVLVFMKDFNPNF